MFSIFFIHWLHWLKTVLLQLTSIWNVENMTNHTPRIDYEYFPIWKRQCSIWIIRVSVQRNLYRWIGGFRKKKTNWSYTHFQLYWKKVKLLWKPVFIQFIPHFFLWKTSFYTWHSYNEWHMLILLYSAIKMCWNTF